MISTDIKYRRETQPKIVSSLQLKAGQLQNVQLRVVRQQIQCRPTQIATDRDLESAGLQHFSSQRRHSRLSVRTCYTDDGCLRGLYEEINVAANAAALIACVSDERMIQSHSRAHDHVSATVDDVGVHVSEHRRL